MKYLKKGSTIYLLCQIIVTHLLSLYFLNLVKLSLEYPSDLYSQSKIMIIFSMVILIFLTYINREALLYFGLISSFVLNSIIGYPFGEYLTFDLLSMMNIIAVSILRLSKPMNILVAIICIISAILLQNPSSLLGFSAFGISLDPLSPSRIFEFSIILLLITFANILIRLTIEVIEKDTNELDRLYANILHLTNMNIVFQDKAIVMKEQSASNERNRILREVHDITGYYFTNILMLLKAALILIKNDSDKAQKTIENSIMQVLKGIDEIRSTLKILDSIRSPKKIDNRTALFDLIQTFKTLTDVDIQMEFGNLQNSYGKHADMIIYRFIQEGLTNSFRHGRATKVRIQFWTSEDKLIININDNGKGSVKFSKGIGLKGMEERMRQLGGIVQAGNVVDGFQLSAFIPLPIGVRNE